MRREDASWRRGEVSGRRRGRRAVVAVAAEAAPADNDKVSRLGQICARAGEPIRGPLPVHSAAPTDAPLDRPRCPAPRQGPRLRRQELRPWCP
jgi:hypothetical protein